MGKSMDKEVVYVWAEFSRRVKKLRAGRKEPNQKEV
jgi:hypothetical protein